MRKIKFRYWCKIENKMYDKAYVDEHLNLAFMSELLESAQERYIFQQFTGLKDMNEKEIYEGDVVRREFEVGRGVFDPVTYGFVDYEIKESGYFIGRVHYRPSEGFVLNNCLKFDSDEELLEVKSGVKIYSSYAEVIGNIYENPELLKEEVK